MRKLQLNTSYKYHFIIGFLIGLWLVVFLVLIAPFDAAELSFAIRLQILPLYGLISFISYIILIPLQNLVFEKMKKWNLISEILFIIVFNTISFFGSYAYYKSSIINGNYSFTKFTLEVYLPILVILLSVIVFARWFLNNKIPKNSIQKLILTGENKLDILQINPSDLICISSADNYVEVNYLKKGKLHKKLLRNTLKNISNQEPNLIKVHRSHFINPSHFKEWKNSNTLVLTETEVPISKNYKQALIDVNHSPLKVDSLSQS
ncbi:MAG: LytTR family transcriptional regulator [Flavobacteriaceae bacterium]